MVVPYGDLRLQYASIKDELDAAIQRVVDSGEFERGEELDSFEASFAAACGRRFAIGVGSGYAALFLALKAGGLGPGDEVITAANTDVASASAISHTGATPVFADIDARTFNIDPALLEARITPRTRAIMPIHLYGLTADMDPILDIARRHDLLVVEDAALAFGARYHGRLAGSMGHFGCFSFAPHKILGAYGDGGMVVTDDPELADRVRLWGSYGERRIFEQVGTISLLKPLEHEVEGYHNHLDTLQAAILHTKLSYVDGWIARRREVAATYTAVLAGTSVLTPAVPEGYEHVHRNYVIRLENRDEARLHLARRGIRTNMLYTPPVHLQPMYRQRGYGEGDLPVTEQVAKELLCLPMFPELTEEQIEYVAGSLKEVSG
jgi:dTDP-4-amino-4,6-dideoxygalactose transaminase